MEWKLLQFIFWLAVRATLNPYLQASAGVIYYVKPTDKPCIQNSSCPSGEECHIMDDYASNSSHYFSPDHINVTLYFLCGVHTCTKRMDVKDLQKFVTKGTAGRHNVVINMISMAVPTRDPEYDSKHKYTFANVSDVVIEELTIYNISVGFEGNDCKLYGKNISFYGPIGTSHIPRTSVITITGCHALFDACTFQYNTFVRLRSRAELAIKDCDFHSYNHVNHSAIVRQDGCAVVLSGVVNFTNNTVGSSTSTYASCGGVFFLAPVAPIVHTNKCCSLVLNVSQDANIYFINNTADCGGMLCLASTKMNVGSRVNITLHQNKVTKYRDIVNYFFGGAILAEMSDITFGESTNIQISSNIGDYGGGIYLWKNSSLVMNRNAAIKLVNNKAYSLGGAMFLEQSNFSIINAVLWLWNNTAVEAGGAISLRGSSMDIRKHANVTFVNNAATLQAGAVYQSIAGSISIDMHSSLEFYSNSAGQGGVLYLTSPGSLIVGHNSTIIFANNTALEVGGAVYAYTHLDLPCFLFLSSHSSLKTMQQEEEVHTYMVQALRALDA